MSPGEIIGALSIPGMVTAKQIESERLEFQGVPSFDPSPFLDDLGRSIFQHPIQHALSPQDSFQEVPVVKIHCSLQERKRLYAKLDSSSRLGMVGISEVLTGYQAGLFSVAKDLCKDRLIFDSRPFNNLEVVPGRWVKGMASIAPLLDLQLGQDDVCLINSTDLRDFYYGFKISHERMVRNSLVGPVEVSDCRHFRCYRPELEKDGHCYLSLNSLAMGDSQAVEIAQTAHLGLLVQKGLITESNLLTMNGSVPRSPTFAGIVIDDLVAFEVMLKSQFMEVNETPSAGSHFLGSALDSYNSVGLLPHPKKTFKDQLQSEFWGCQFDGLHGVIMANLKRTIPVVAVTCRIIQMNTCSVGLLEVLVGAWNSIFLFRRRLLSLLNIVYQVGQLSDNRKHVITLSPELREELFMCISLAPLAVTRLKVPNSKFLYSSDASEWGIGVTRAPLPEWLQKEVHRHKLKRSVWTKLLSPLRAFNRIKGVLPPSEELPDGQIIAGHPLWIELSTCLDFKEVARKKMVEGRHINILELRGMLRSEIEAAHECFPLRYFSLSDSQVCLGSWTKGRSASYGLNQELQQSLEIHLGCGMYGNTGYVPTEVNTSDPPSRNLPVQPPLKKPPPCFQSAAEGSFEEFDAWLESYGAEPYQTSGLPLNELFQRAEDYLEGTGRKARTRAHFKRAEAAVQAAEERTKDGCPFVTLSRTKNNKKGHPDLSQVKSEFLPDECGRKLSCEAREILKKVPFDQFVLPSEWRGKVDRNWRPSRAGFLDIYSGEKGIARAIVSLAKTWVITFEISDSPLQDVLSPKNKALIEELIRCGCIVGFGAAIFCASFSRAVRPPVRSRAEPFGFKNITAAMRIKVDLGNLHAEWVAELVALCEKCGILFWVENPDGSYLWFLPCFVALGSQRADRAFRLDYCTMGTCWRKRSRFLCNTHLAGQTFWCSRQHKHVPLQGWCKAKGVSWTRLAQTYPKRLCILLAKSLLIDSGMLPGRRKIQMSAISRVEHARIGEASHPGPRRPKAVHKRQDVNLDSVRLVEPSTLRLGKNIWHGFLRWLSAEFDRDSINRIIGVPEVLSVLVSEFGKHLFETGQSIYLYRQLVTHIQREDPNMRGRLGLAWQTLNRWDYIEPVCHRTPLPYALFRAMVLQQSI